MKIKSIIIKKIYSISVSENRCIKEEIINKEIIIQKYKMKFAFHFPVEASRNKRSI